MANDQTITKGVAYAVVGGPDGVAVRGGKAYAVTAVALNNLAIAGGKAYLVTTPQTGDLAGTIQVEVTLSATLDTNTVVPSARRRRFMVVAGGA